MYKVFIERSISLQRNLTDFAMLDIVGADFLREMKISVSGEKIWSDI